MHLCRRCGGTGCRYKPSPNRWVTCNKCRGHGTWGIPGPAVIACKGFNVARKSKDEGKAQAERDEKRRMKKLRKSFKVDTPKE